MDPQRLLDVIEDIDARLADQSRRLNRLENELTLVVDANRQAQAALIAEIMGPVAASEDFDDFGDEDDDDEEEE